MSDDSDKDNGAGRVLVSGKTATLLSVIAVLFGGSALYVGSDEKSAKQIIDSLRADIVTMAEEIGSLKGTVATLRNNDLSEMRRTLERIERKIDESYRSRREELAEGSAQ